jgi:hypothetical protein
MSPEELDAFQRAADLYRSAWTQVLSKLTGPQPAPIEQYVEELKEALLDLKQAAIDLDPPRVVKYSDEVTQIITDLRDLMHGG